MKIQEKEILRKIVNHHKGLLSPAQLFNVIGESKRLNKEIHRLISSGYIEEVPHTIPSGKQMNFYRASEKGCQIFLPFHKKIWLAIKKDIRTIFVAVITSIITSLIILAITKLFK